MVRVCGVGGGDDISQLKQCFLCSYAANEHKSKKENILTLRYLKRGQYRKFKVFGSLWKSDENGFSASGS